MLLSPNLTQGQAGVIFTLVLHLRHVLCSATLKHVQTVHFQELVWILHKALEASQLEKRTCAEFVAETGEQERLELLRHRERQAADLRRRLEEAKEEVEALSRSLTQKDAQLIELQEEVGMLKEKNNAKQEVRTGGA